MTTTTPSGVSHTTSVGKITLDKISKSDFQKEGTLSAQLRQIVTTVSSYPSKKTATELQANIFDNAEFGFEAKTYESTEARIAWIPVPANIDQAVLEAKLVLANEKGACIYRVLSNAPILDENQKYAITAGIRTLDQFAATQAVRYPENEKTIADGTANKLTLDKAGNVQYRRTFFWNSPMADVDVRGTVEPYVSPELMAELAGASVMQGQNL